MRTERELLAEALAVQDACNLSGVVHSYSRAMTDLWDLARRVGGGTEWVNTHPVAVLYADKVRHLSGLDERVFAAYQTAHDIVNGVAA